MLTDCEHLLLNPILGIYSAIIARRNLPPQGRKRNRAMESLLQDFFCPDLQASNRQIRKYLEAEGISLAYREILTLKNLARQRIFLSYALLDSLSREISDLQMQEWLEGLESGQANSPDSNLEWEKFVLRDGAVLVGLCDEFAECSRESKPINSFSAAEPGQALVPVASVFGQNLSLNTPGVGGVWQEDALHADSVTLLDGEDEKELVEAFRHLYRAAPDGQAKAAVIAVALRRQKRALSLEVTDKLQEFSVTLGRSLRQLFHSEHRDERIKALAFLLAQETTESPPPWVGFWRSIRTSVLETLASGASQRQLLRENILALVEVLSGSDEAVITPPVLDALLEHPERLTTEEGPALIEVVLSFLKHSQGGLEILEHRLQLSSDFKEQLIIGEALRRWYLLIGHPDGLKKLMQRFGSEALSVGSTANTLALSELLVSFGSELLELPALTDLDGLTPRQVLRAVEIWEQVALEEPECFPRVSQLFLKALDEQSTHPAIDLSLLLKTSMLARDEVFEAFCRWCQEAPMERRREIFLATSNWTLSTPNRTSVARALVGLEGFGADLWAGEWRKPTLSFQRLGWLAQCLTPEIERRPRACQSEEQVIQTSWPLWTTEMEAKVFAALRSSSRNLYFWDLLRRCARFGPWSDELRTRALETARRLFQASVAGDPDEKEAFLGAAAAMLMANPNTEEVQWTWVESLKSDQGDDFQWTLELVTATFVDPGSRFIAAPHLISAILQRLLHQGRISMQQIMARALTEGEEALGCDGALTLEHLNSGLKALGAIASHPLTSGNLKGSLRRRLAIFLQDWIRQLSETSDLYAFRSTPLFSILEPLIQADSGDLQELLDQAVLAMLLVHRRTPERLRLEVRQSAQSFLNTWVEHRDPGAHPEAASWQKILEELRAERTGE